MDIRKWAPYIGVAVGILTVTFLWLQHVRQEKQAALEMELERAQLDLLKNGKV